MTTNYKSQQVANSTISLNDQTAGSSVPEAISAGLIEGDDRFPGSFFRIPGVPLPGKTTWSLAE
jgi:hypothetical protein